MTAYQYRTVDLSTNRVLEDMSLRGVQFVSLLNGQGTLIGTLYAEDTRKSRLLDDATIPGRTGIYALRDDVPVWGGVIWSRDWYESTASWTLNCKSWESYAYHVVQLKDKAYTNTDQIQIGIDLLNDPNPTIYASSGIETPAFSSSGVMRQRYMYGYERKTVGSELESLAALNNSFDYRVDNYVKVDGSLGRRYVFGYPRLGRSASASDPTSLTFDFPGNLQPFQLVENAESGAWTVYSIGSGEGTSMLLAQDSDTAYGSAGWPTLDAVTQYKSVVLQPTLQSHATSDLNNSLPPLSTWKLTLSPNSDVQLKDFSLGDSAVFRINSRRWRTPMVFVARIVQVTVHPGDPGQAEIVELGLGQPVIGQDTIDNENKPATPNTAA